MNIYISKFFTETQNSWFITFLATFFGAIFAFLFNYYKERITSFTKQKEQLITYFALLNTALRNASILLSNIEVIKNDGNLKLPLHNIICNLETQKLIFVSKDQPILFENLIQLEIELKSIKEYGSLYNETKLQKYIDSCQHECAISLVKIIITMENINTYAKNYYDLNNMITKQINENFEEISKFMKKVKTLNEEIIKIKEGWEVKISIPPKVKKIKSFWGIY